MIIQVEIYGPRATQRAIEANEISGARWLEEPAERTLGQIASKPGKLIGRLEIDRQWLEHWFYYVDGWGAYIVEEP